VRNVHSAITASGHTAEEREAAYLYWQHKREEYCNEDDLIELASKE
jgi:hypothetical protein